MSEETWESVNQEQIAQKELWRIKMQEAHDRFMNAYEETRVYYSCIYTTFGYIDEFIDILASSKEISHKAEAAAFAACFDWPKYLLKSILCADPESYRYTKDLTKKDLDYISTIIRQLYQVCKNDFLGLALQNCIECLRLSAVEIEKRQTSECGTKDGNA